MTGAAFNADSFEALVKLIKHDRELLAIKGVLSMHQLGSGHIHRSRLRYREPVVLYYPHVCEEKR